MKRALSIAAFAVFAAGIFAQTPNSEGAAQFAQEFIRNNVAVFNQSATLRANTVNPSDRGVSNTPLYQTAKRSQRPYSSSPPHKPKAL